MAGRLKSRRSLLCAAGAAAVVALLAGAFVCSGFTSQGGPVGPTGLKVSLSSPQREFRLGGPLRFRVVVRNLSFRNVVRDFQHYLHPVFEITGPGGKKVPEVFGDMSSSGGDVTLRPFQALCVQDEDLHLMYHVVEEGEYTIRVKSLGKDLPESNELSFTVRGGTVSEAEKLVSALLRAAPAPWRVGRYSYDFEALSLPGFEKAEGLWMQLMYGPRHEKRIDILFSKSEGPELASGAWSGRPLRYAGSGMQGHFYFCVYEKTAETWPTYEEDLKKALGIE